MKEFRDAIDLCVDRHLVLPALTLIYTTIDVSAWITYDDTRVGDRFERWCNSHLLPRSKLKATAVDLYGARCGVLHTLSSESTKSVRGTAREIVYGWGNADHRQLQEAIDLAGHPGYVSIQVEELRDALSAAIDCLVDEASGSPQMLEKAGKVLAVQSQEAADRLLNEVRASRGDV